MRYSKSANLLQINELIEEVSRETLDVPKILKLFEELFEDLVAVTTAWKCVEIDRFCTIFFVSEEFERLPLALQDIVGDCLSLDDYPSEFCWFPPQELLERINELCRELRVDLQSVKTKKDMIIEMYERGIDEKGIAEELGIDQGLVETVLVKAAYKLEWSIKTTIDRIIEMHEKGVDIEEIAKELGATQHLIKTVLRDTRQK